MRSKNSRHFKNVAGLTGTSSLSGMSRIKMMKVIEHQEQIIQEQNKTILELKTELLTFKERISELELHASIDSATGFFNNEYFEQVGNYLFEQAKRAHHTDNKDLDFSVVVVDVNGLKLINDTFGHEAGDMLIAKSATSIADSFERHTDVHGRIGGDEFALLLPKTATEVIRQKFKEINENSYFDLKDGTRIQIKMAYGISSYKEQASFKEMRNEADMAMYAEKIANKAQKITTSWEKPSTGLPLQENNLG